MHWIRESARPRGVTVTEINNIIRAHLQRARCVIYIYIYKCEQRSATGFFRITGARTEPIFQIIVRTGMGRPILVRLIDRLLIRSERAH